jgi:hypothetical protein
MDATLPCKVYLSSLGGRLRCAGPLAQESLLDVVGTFEPGKSVKRVSVEISSRLFATKGLCFALLRMIFGIAKILQKPMLSCAYRNVVF